MAKASIKQMEYAKSISELLNIELPETEDRFVIGAFISKNKDAAAIKQEELNQNIYAQIKDEVKIIDIAREMGMTLTRKGSYFSTKEHDSVRIKPDENIYFRNSSGNKGTVIDFVMEFSGKEKNTVIQELSERIDGRGNTTVYKGVELPSNSSKIKQEFILPKKGDNMRNMYAYLTISRNLDPDIVQDLVKTKLLYQDERKNCVFVSYKDKIPVFATTVGTNSFVPFKGDIVGCDYMHGWHIDNGSDKLYITEAPIDAISKMSIMKAAHKDYRSYDYLAMTGTGKFESVFSHVKSGKYSEIYVGIDNDSAGIKCLEKIRTVMREEFPDIKVFIDQPIITKDWNDELKYLFTKRYRYENYINPSDRFKDVLQEEVKAILNGDKMQEEFWKKSIKNMGYSDELQDYVADYLFHHREAAIADMKQNSFRSVEAIISNYNRQTHITVRSLNPMKEYENIKSELLSMKYGRNYLTQKEYGFNDGIERAITRIQEAYERSIGTEEIESMLLKELHNDSNISKREEGFNQGIKDVISKMNQMQSQKELGMYENSRNKMFEQGIEM